ncbi:MAG: hypothetical protein EXR71_16235 [Myxococcales bacterium]|nr:hypothetical protein [Myxococcales bacterium]
MHSLDPRVVTLWRFEALLAVCTSWVPIYAGMGWILGTKVGVVTAVAGVAALIVLLVARALVWPALAFRNFRYEVRAHELIVEQGVLFRQTISVPRDRIQHVDTRQAFWERWLDVSRLLVYTGAGLSSDASLPGLDAEEAVRLRDQLARPGRGVDDGV